MSKIIRRSHQPKQRWFISPTAMKVGNNNELSILEPTLVVVTDLRAKGHDVTYKAISAAIPRHLAGHAALLHFFC
jgi:hypothetical protein